VKPCALRIRSEEGSVVAALIAGQPVEAPGTIVFTCVVCVVFIAVAFWKWDRTEL
jgi:hypothetical protein